MLRQGWQKPADKHSNEISLSLCQNKKKMRRISHERVKKSE